MIRPNVISLGSYCRTRYQIERFFTTFIALEQITYPTYFWDWLCMGGSRGVIWSIENDFQLERDEFEIFFIENQNSYKPRHKPSGFCFLHDFGGGGVI